MEMMGGLDYYKESGNWLIENGGVVDEDGEWKLVSRNWPPIKKFPLLYESAL
jgi:hypothetical protein